MTGNGEAMEPSVQAAGITALWLRWRPQRLRQPRRLHERNIQHDLQHPATLGDERQHRATPRLGETTNG